MNTKHKFLMTLDLSDYSRSLAEYFHVIEYGVFYNMSKTWKTEVLIKNY